MNHRLFHTLVLSGAALVEGCATATAPAPELSPASETAPVSARAAEAQPQPDAPPAAPQVVGGAPNSGDPALEAMINDVRACNDVGWPTTKSASMYYRSVMRGERQYFCANDPTQQRFRGLPHCCELVTR